MGRFDNCEWVKVDDLSCIEDLEFPKEVLINLFKKIFEIAEMEGIE